MKKCTSILLPVILVFVIFFYNSSNAQNAQVKLRNTELRKIKSSFVDEEYEIQIYLPPAYSESSKSFPVLYLLDADKSFGMTRDIVDWLIFGREIPQIIVVGISYGKDTNYWWDKRSRDYTPSKAKQKIFGSDWPISGGADNFKNFIKQELFVFMDKNYRIFPNNRAIAGLSFGGLFATYILFTEPNLFNRYIISGPALIWDEKMVFGKEEEYSKTNDTLKAKVFMSIGELDYKEKIIQPWEEFSKIIEKRQYKELQFKSIMIQGETHFSVWPASLTKGIKEVFSEN